jgi:hypothetical protein
MPSTNRDRVCSDQEALDAEQLDIALHAVHSDGQVFLQGEVRRVLGQPRSERTNNSATILRIVCKRDRPLRSGHS